MGAREAIPGQNCVGGCVVVMVAVHSGCVGGFGEAASGGAGELGVWGVAVGVQGDGGEEF